MSRNNLSRSLGDSGLFSLEAWHVSFDKNTNETELFVHVNFDTARMGGDKDSPVNFELRLKRATIIVHVPKEDGFKVDLSTVARAEPSPRSFTRSTEIKTSFDGSVGAGVSGKGLTGQLSSKVGGEKTDVETMKEEMDLYSISVTDGKIGELSLIHI